MSNFALECNFEILLGPLRSVVAGTGVLAYILIHIFWFTNNIGASVSSTKKRYEEGGTLQKLLFCHWDSNLFV